MTFTLDKTALDASLLIDQQDPAAYIIDEQNEGDRNLVAAANAAIALGKPLLLTGEPGIGKSQFAGWLAHQAPKHELYQFVIKSDTKGADLFYQFDHLARFRDAQLDANLLSDKSGNKRVSKKTLWYVKYNALGKAILQSMGRSAAEQAGYVSESTHPQLWPKLNAAPEPTVVLIDEIDKAPRDVPNDLLDEIENLQFNVPELDCDYAKASARARPLVVITSNSERDLPRAFMRRCIYFHMGLPDIPKLEKIARARIGQRFSGRDGLLGQMVKSFHKMHQHSSFRQPPSVAELINWVTLVADQPSASLQAQTAKIALFKDNLDQEMFDKDPESWLG